MIKAFYHLFMAWVYGRIFAATHSAKYWGKGYEQLKKCEDYFKGA